MCFSLQRCAIFRPHNCKKWPVPLSFLTFWLWNVLLATAACNFSTSQLQKAVRPWGVLYILTSKCASRYSGVQFFHIATSKSGPRMLCFVHFDFKMCFSLQRRAIFPNLNFQKCSETVSFVCNILTWKCASRYSGVQFFHIATSKSGPRPSVFYDFDLEMCFSPQRRAIFHFRAQQPPPHPPLYRGYFSTQPTHKSLKNTAFRDFPNISRLWIFFLLTFAQLYLLSSDSTSLLCFFIFWLYFSALLFQLSILSEVRLLNFLRLDLFYQNKHPKTKIV